ncbi:hypothetical protein HS041_07440 [Planomonospora sp. ID67723]|uniref:hypothetical protein n=1 Tax=Planomonospora sp. ID67723 TaxID=2738134 RepID=UPI0018C37C8A|nr:hypothetical protein [Planomonospora sp. ID67723]MBG0827595.1 hypothetical protein [Planomonospora sp. ID67723]
MRAHLDGPATRRTGNGEPAVRGRAARLVRGRVLAALLALLVPVLVLANIGLPFSAAGIKEISGGVGILDLEPRDSAEGVRQALDAYGEEGRERYLLLLATLDVLLPLLFALTCALVLAMTLGRAARWLWAVPAAGMVADYAENVVLVILLTGHPSPGPAGLMPALTAVKSAAVMTDLLLVGVGLVYAAVRRIARSRSRAAR